MNTRLLLPEGLLDYISVGRTTCPQIHFQQPRKLDRHKRHVESVTNRIAPSLSTIMAHNSVLAHRCTFSRMESVIQAKVSLPRAIPSPARRGACARPAICRHGLRQQLGAVIVALRLQITL
jgi:hypothetical protein